MTYGCLEVVRFHKGIFRPRPLFKVCSEGHVGLKIENGTELPSAPHMLNVTYAHDIS